MFAHHNFNLTRFYYVAKRDCLEHGKDFLKMWGGMFLGFFFISLLTAFPYFLHYDATFEYTVVAFISFFAAYIFTLIGASFIFSDLKTKQARINYYMLPATSAEKYVSRLIQSTLLVVIGVIVAFLAADVLNWVIRAIVREGGDLVTLHLFDQLDQFNFMHVDLIEDTDTQIIIQPEAFILPLPFFLFLSAEATYILGGTLFRRYAFILTTAFIFVLSVVITLILTLVASFIAKHYVDDFPTDIASESITQYILWLSVAIYLFHLLWTIGCIYFYYRMFKNSNVIINRSIGL